MLILKPEIRIISRKVTLTNGAEIFAYFAVMDVSGVLQVKFLGTKPIDVSPVSNKAVLLLENIKSQIFGEVSIRTIYEILSPFYTPDFLTSQLARAPSIK